MIAAGKSLIYVHTLFAISTPAEKPRKGQIHTAFLDLFIMT